VHALLSSHPVPFGTGLITHCPLLGLQSSKVVVHSDGNALAGQMTACPTQLPPWQVSPTVHALPSLHVEPSGFAGLEHAPVLGSHAPAT
jgi:hypothetical protein